MADSLIGVGEIGVVEGDVEITVLGRTKLQGGLAGWEWMAVGSSWELNGGGLTRLLELSTKALMVVKELLGRREGTEVSEAREERVLSF
jgi:hypothetical protein